MTRTYHGRPLEPFRIGIIIDLPDHEGYSEVIPRAVQLALDEVHQRGLIERDVELVVREVYAQPWTTAHELIDTYRRLVEQERVLAVFGPATSDNALAVLPEVHRSRVPTVSICGTLGFRGPYAFTLPNGGLADEPYLIAAWLARNGYRRVAVLRERTQIGEEYAEHFRWAAAERELTFTAEVPTYPSMTHELTVDALERCRSSTPDALVYLGLGGFNQWCRPALEELGWDPPRIQTTAFVGATYSEERALRYEGWVGVDQYHEGNEVFAAVLDRYEARFGDRPANSAASVGYDAGHVLGLALGRMRIATPTGLRDALETVRRVPSCTGGPGTVITFGPEDHRGYKGPDFLVLRRAVGGRTVLEGTVPVTHW